MTPPIKILLQTTITAVEDDWAINRFSMLRAYLAGLTDTTGTPLFEVTARDRSVAHGPDPLLSTLDSSDFDEMWLFAVDVGDGLDSADCAAISRFREQGGGLLVTRDHMDLGSSLCTLGGVGRAHFFHSRNPEPEEARRRIDDRETAYILWPNYHSGANGDFQEIEVLDPPHPVLQDPERPGERLRFLPSHPHEGAVGAPADDPSARVIAMGQSKVSGTRFPLAVAFEGTNGVGRGIAQSTFHHFADYNWNSASGCPSFVSEAPSSRLARCPAAQRSVHLYVRNLALWLAGRSPS
ncbi:hypothetical protein GON01_02680 [Sphingomonas sp. MAH-20]|uniref:ThuA-like domain-containing protein n=1 Tax=Sphingomonas horti TaxID=2682842 RepID=A0A6I4IXI4_9SPHN|nr:MULTISPECIES: hypothetical protein [Sphingomonas]MBA2920858.1 hypothetical protein [Sphingomonas sp. CGMCC 1.13658]MVO76844.1 hypothetical protein [Sphingomonas horti]